ncbi:Eco57I restriction-modification methylase domain-containing protein [Burkholderia cenocepacia]|uniref:Eco57I restriction-modification methylase domain-containing protein n=1 Tax=Burkholderia cenocepacia TaxID=95486 RepID=UPI002857B87F|nr:N-6 DNA methylase [Burkholderia cenocepacia]MDR8057678.1 SAM-dependent methyltransferase [Burkholderia cenocepacia]MDR8062230.1 SAM-dependent methyltransferase [Burkholderia cenocepacia]
MKTSNNVGRDLDQFYTNPQLAQRLFDELIAEHLGDRWSGDVRWLEPSCGTGAFLSLLPPDALGVDLDPKCPGAVQADFLSWTPPAGDDRPLVVVGNPPFKHDVAFFNRCAELGAERIAFIVPRSWQKPSVQNQLDRAFHLAHEEVLPLDAFIFEGQPAEVPTVFQVWERRDEQRPLTVLPTKHADFAFVPYAQRHTADFAIQRVGVHAGRVKDLDAEHLGQGSHRFVRVIDRTRVAEVRAVFEAIDWAPVKACVAGNPSIANGEMVQAYALAVVDRWFATTDWFADVAAAAEHPVVAEPVLPVAPMTIPAVYERIAELVRLSGMDAQGRMVGGVVYTPFELARTMVDLARLQPHETVLEPSCGRGSLVFAMVDHWLARGLTHEQVARYCEEKLFVSDLDGQAVQDLADLYRAYFASYGVTSELNARVGDALFAGWSDRTFDATIANPPYVGLGKLPKDYAARVRASFSTCAKGMTDLYQAFIEQAQTQSTRAVVIAPNAWMRTKAGTALRNLLRPRVRSVVDFEHRRVFLGPLGASVLTAIVVTGPATQAPVLFRTDMPHESDTPWTVAFRQKDEAMGPAAWALDPAMLGDAIDPKALTVGDLADVLVGVNTNANGAYIVQNGTVDGDAVQAVNRHGRAVRLPVADAPLFLKLTKVKTLADALASDRLLFPYGEDLKLIAEAALNPEVLNWFRDHSARLLARDGGDLRSYEAWYAYGRKQGFYAFDPDERLLLVPCMAKGPMDVLDVTPADLGGRFLWASGYVVRAKNPADHVRLKALLNAPSTWRFLRRRGKQWTGGHRTFTPEQLRAVPEVVTVPPATQPVIAVPKKNAVVIDLSTMMAVVPAV